MRKSWETAARVSASSSGHQVTPAAAGRDQCHLLPYFFCSHFIIGFLKNSKRIQSKWVNITFPPALVKGEDCSQYLLLLQLNTMLIHVWEKTSTPLSNLPAILQGTKNRGLSPYLRKSAGLNRDWDTSIAVEDPDNYRLEVAEDEATFENKLVGLIVVPLWQSTIPCIIIIILWFNIFIYIIKFLSCCAMH